MRYLVLLLLAACGGAVPTSATIASNAIVVQESYDQLVLTDRPVFYLNENGEDLTGNAPGEPPFGGLAEYEQLPNADWALRFDGLTQSICYPDSDLFSISTTGELTLEVWLKPAVLEFPKDEPGGYVHFLGKGVGADNGIPAQHEYVLRIYSYTNAENRPNRLSGYAYDLVGGLGAGSYAQDAIRVGEWIHLVVVFNINDVSETYPTGYVALYKNGVLRDKDPLLEHATPPRWDIHPQNGTAPFCIGTRNGSSFFRGALGKAAVYNYELTPAQIQAHFTRMWQ